MLSRQRQASYLMREIAMEHLSLYKAIQSDAYKQLVSLQLSWGDLFSKIEDIPEASQRGYLRNLSEQYCFDFVLQHFSKLNLRQNRDLSVLERSSYLLGLLYNPFYDWGEFCAGLDMLEIEIREECKNRKISLRRISNKINDSRFAYEILQVVNTILFQKMQITGNEGALALPECHMVQSLLGGNASGIPLSISILYIILCGRLGLPVFGVNMPGRFLVKWVYEDLELFIDPFDSGAFIEKERIALLLHTQFMGLSDRLFEATQFDVMIRRAFGNLIALYKRGNELEKALYLEYLNRYVSAD